MIQINKVLVFLSISAATLFSCSRFEPEQMETQIIHKIANPVSVSYEVAWEIFSIRTSDNRYNPMIATSPNQVLIEGASIIDSTPYLFALNTSNGSQIWQKQVESSPSQLLVSDPSLYRGTGGVGSVQSYDLSTGELLWKTVLPRAHSVTYFNHRENNLFANTNDYAFFLLNTDGTILESKSTNFIIFYENDATGFLGNSNAIQALDKLSKVVEWRMEFTDGLGFSPIFDEDTIFIRTGGFPHNLIYSINQRTGEINWQLNTSAISNLCKAGDLLFYLTTDGKLMILDAGNGQQIEKLAFSPSFELNDGYLGRYYVSADPATNMIIISFGDTSQIIALRQKL